MTLDGLARAFGLGSAWGGRALARAVSAGGSGLRVATLGDGIARALTTAGHTPLVAPAAGGRLPLEDRAADALCASALPPLDEALPLLHECTRVVRPGGRLLIATPAGLARRGPERHLVIALLLHAGLLDLEQRRDGTVLITSGRV